MGRIQEELIPLLHRAANINQPNFKNHNIWSLISILNKTQEAAQQTHYVPRIYIQKVHPSVCWWDKCPEDRRKESLLGESILTMSSSSSLESPWTWSSVLLLGNGGTGFLSINPLNFWLWPMVVAPSDWTDTSGRGCAFHDEILGYDRLWDGFTWEVELRLCLWLSVTCWEAKSQSTREEWKFIFLFNQEHQ